jgi:hypothetical protein
VLYRQWPVAVREVISIIEFQPLVISCLFVSLHKMKKRIRILVKVLIIFTVILFTASEFIPGSFSQVADICCPTVHSEESQTGISIPCTDCSHDESYYSVEGNIVTIFTEIYSINPAHKPVAEADLYVSIWQPPES